MLALRQQVGSQKLCIRSIIRQHHYFTGSGQQINGNSPHQLAFGLHHKTVAGTKIFSTGFTLSVPSARAAIA